MPDTPVKRLIRSRLSMDRYDLLLHGHGGFGSGSELNPFLLLEDPYDDVSSWVLQSGAEQDGSVSALSPGD